MFSTRFLFLVFCPLLVLTGSLNEASAADGGGYQTPKQAGFHHCALIYDSPVRGVRELTPYVMRTLPNGELCRGEWLFDAYLFLIFVTPGGVRTENGLTRMGDWQYCLDRWFGADRDLAALDEAIERAALASGTSPAKRNVMLTIPYLNRHVQDFGDVDHDGRTEDLATEAGRQAVIKWYRDEAVRRFAAAKYRHLHLWGFYCMAEGISQKDAPAIRAVADAVHAAGLRFLWIPWYSAPGWEQWKELGFDTAIMQPNYAFKSNTHKGRVRRNRLDINAAKARSAGMGVEMEAGSILKARMDWQPFLHYLVDGASDRLGYQQGAMAYYLETHIVEEACYSTNAQHRVWYDRLADFVANKKVVDPLAAVVTGSRTTSDTLVVSGRFAAPRALGAMDVLIDEPEGTRPWTGVAEVRTRVESGAPFVTGGWAVRSEANSQDGRWQVLTVPLDAKVLEFEIVLKSHAGANLPAAANIRPDPIDADELVRHAALGARYVMSPLPKPVYGDTPARLLTDGIVPARGWGKGRTVGWQGNKIRASVVLDLGKEFAIERVEVHGPGGGGAGVNFPASTMVMIASNRPAPVEASGIGAMPSGFTVGTCGPLEIGRRRSATDADGHVPVTFPAGACGRYVTVSQQGSSWLMLSEIRVFSGGTNVAVSAPYTLSPPPTPAATDESRKKNDGPRYTDDGVRLTDGIIAQGFSRAQVTGWRGKENRGVTVDLSEARAVRKVRVWVLRGGKSGIFAPGKVTVAVSSDGTQWATPIPASAPQGPAEDGKQWEAASFDTNFPADTTAKQVRIDFAPGKGWTMVSEIEVR